MKLSLDLGELLWPPFPNKMHAQSKHGKLHESHFTSIFFLDSLNCCFVLFNTGIKRWDSCVEKPWSTTAPDQGRHSPSMWKKARIQETSSGFSGRSCLLIGTRFLLQASQRLEGPGSPPLALLRASNRVPTQDDTLLSPSSWDLHLDLTAFWADGKQVPC